MIRNTCALCCVLRQGALLRGLRGLHVQGVVQAVKRSVPRPAQPAQRHVPVTFLTENPGRQGSLLTGSFHPLSDDQWEQRASWHMDEPLVPGPSFIAVDGSVPRVGVVACLLLSSVVSRLCRHAGCAVLCGAAAVPAGGPRRPACHALRARIRAGAR